MHLFSLRILSGNRDTYIQWFSAISVTDCKSVFDFVTKPGAPTGIGEKRYAIDWLSFAGV